VDLEIEKLAKERDEEGSNF